MHACVAQCGVIQDGVQFTAKTLDKMQLTTTDKHEGVKQCKAFCRCSLLVSLAICCQWRVTKLGVCHLLDSTKQSILVGSRC